ncbi:hypothetical protein [Photobacterium kishitanii]|nr:hypothetical protein [Photobacterium kishitanii]
MSNRAVFLIPRLILDFSFYGFVGLAIYAVGYSVDSSMLSGMIGE